MKTDKLLQIDMINYGKDFYIRNTAKVVYSELIGKYKFEDFEIILINFSGVEQVSTGFAYDLFKFFRQQLKEDFIKKIRVSFGEAEKAVFLKSVVKGAYNSQFES